MAFKQGLIKELARPKVKEWLLRIEDFRKQGLTDDEIAETICTFLEEKIAQWIYDNVKVT